MLMQNSSIQAFVDYGDLGMDPKLLLKQDAAQAVGGLGGKTGNSQVPNAYEIELEKLPIEARTALVHA